MRGEPGFTLIELLVALAIAALLTTLAMPSMAGYLQRHRLQATAQDLAHDLARAREAATLAGTARWLVVQDGPEWCWAIARTPACGCGSPAPCQLQRVAADDRREVRALLLLDGTARDVRIDPASTRRVAPIHIALQGASGQKWQVRLSPLGRPGSCRADASSPAC